MPSKTWTSQADFTEWTHTNTVATVAGAIELDTGQQSGYAVSPVYEAAAWANWGRLAITAPHATGTNVLARVRSGASSVECAAATYSDYYGEVADGVIYVPLREYFLDTPAATVGKFLQIRLDLEAE